MAPATFTLRATYNKPNGEPQIQSRPVHIYVTGTKQVKDTAGNVIISGRVEADVVDGVLTVPGLPDPRDPGYNPDNFGLTVSAVFRDNHPPAVSFGAEALDAHLTNGVLELEDVTPVDPSTFTPNATYAETSTVTALDTRVTTLETTPTVTSYNDLTDTPDIPATAADVGAEPAGLAQTTNDALAATYAGRNVVNDAAALPILGSPRTGNLTLGAGTRSLAGTTQHNAFPGLAACPDGSLLAAWREAANHEPTATGVIRARKSKDKGLIWGAPYTIASDALDVRDPNLTTLSDGTLVLQCFKHDGTNGEGVYLATSTDNGNTFSALTRVPFTFTLSTSSSSRVVELPDGSWLVAAYGKNVGEANRSARTIKSTDRGATWGTEATIATGTRSYEEPYIGIRPDGKLMAIIRTSDNVLYKAESANGGATWAGLNRADGGLGTLANSGGRPAWTAIRSYGILLTYRHMAAPYPLRFVTSWDNGGTWSSSTQLGATPANQSVYAQPVEVARGLIAVAYAVEESLTSARADFAYLLDGNGVSPLGDTNPPPGAGTGIAKEYLKLRKSADQALLANTYTAITWDIEKNDSWGGHSGTSADFTVNETGLYFIAPRIQTGYDADISLRLVDKSNPNNPLLQDFRKANIPNTLLSTGIAWLEVGKTYQMLAHFSIDGQLLGGDFAYRTELTVAKIKGS